MRLLSKGQLVISRDLQEQGGLRPEDELALHPLHDRMTTPCTSSSSDCSPAFTLRRNPPPVLRARHLMCPSVVLKAACVLLISAGVGAQTIRHDQCREIPGHWLGWNANLGGRVGCQQPEFAEAVAALRPGSIRYPGGSVGNYWNWRAGWTSFGQMAQLPAARMMSQRPPRYPNTPADLGIIIGLTQALPVWMLRMQTSTLEDQLELLRTADAHGLRVELVELGGVRLGVEGTGRPTTIWDARSGGVANCPRRPRFFRAWDGSVVMALRRGVRVALRGTWLDLTSCRGGDQSVTAVGSVGWAGSGRWQTASRADLPVRERRRSGVVSLVRGLKGR